MVKNLREIVTTLLEVIGTGCMVAAVALLAGGPWALLALGAAMIGFGVMAG